ncbi:MAG: winged helix DNA-binding domain-containing protein [Geodermatophilaceae bacterium]|nr:winged helix DNA-binding domain-containing protein [Geodermatophilaceae bacterium]
MKLADGQARWYRLRRSGLVERYDTPERVASVLVGVQAQILPAAGLSLWNRAPGLTHARFDGLLHEERTLVKLWGQRGTLHLYPSAEWPLVYSARSEQLTWWERSLEARGGSVERHNALITAIEGMLRERGTMGRSDLRTADLEMEDWHFSSWGGIFADLVRRGYACHAPQAGGEGRFAHREHWLPGLPWDPPAPDEANAELTRRYLHAYGPATVHDFAYWRGVKVSAARRWLAALGDEVTAVEVEDQPMLALRDDLPALAEAPPEREAWPVRMLYRFDPLLLAHKDKGWLVEPHNYARVWRAAGHIEGNLLEHGRIVATWRYDRKPSGLTITLSPFVPLPAYLRAAVERIAPTIATFFGLPLVGLQIAD